MLLGASLELEALVKEAERFGCRLFCGEFEKLGTATEWGVGENPLLYLPTREGFCD